MSNRQLPEEIVIEILTWLPVKSLLRFTAVSKWWRFLITSPAFISAHLHNHRNGNSATNLLLLLLIFRDNREEKYSIINDTDHQFLILNNYYSQLPFPITRDLRVVGYHNGVVCLSGYHAVTLWNPSIRKFRTLLFPPILPDHYPSDSIFGFYSALGFGVSPQSVDDLKVVRIVYARSNGDYFYQYKIPPEVQIYSLKTGMWRRITATGLNYFILDGIFPHAFVNGAVHWIGYKLLENNRLQSVIAVFNMGDELFGEIMLPGELAWETPLNFSMVNLSIMVLEECVVVAKYNRGGGLCELWAMKEYGVVESWTRLYSMELVRGMKTIVGFRKNGEVIFSTDRNKLVSYSPNTRAINNLGISGINRSFCVYKYLESLALLQEQNR